MSINIIDFESRSEAPLGTIGAWNYSLHETTVPLCMAYKIGKDPTKLWKAGEDFPEELLEQVNLGSKFEAFNVSFEIAIWNNLMAKRYGWPELPLDRWLCTEARAAQYAMPRSLEMVAEALGLDIGKDMDGHKVMLQMCKPKKPSKKDPSIWYDDDERYQKLYDYCIRDVDTTYAIQQKLISLTTEKNRIISKVVPYKNKELQIFRLNNLINSRGAYFDKDIAEHAIKLLNIQEDRLNLRLAEITEGRITSINQAVELKKYLNEQGFGIPSLSAGTIEIWMPKAKGEIKEILEIRLLCAKSSTKKFKAMIEQSDEKQMLRELLRYAGAGRTARFSGKGVQIQNFTRPTLPNDEIEKILDLLKNKVSYEDFRELYPKMHETISNCLRGVICAEEGNKFYDSDFAAIEARVLFWLADDEKGLESYREGRDLYKEMASKVFLKPIHKITKEDRQLGKAIILGGGYGMGHKKFVGTCEQSGMNVSLKLAKKSLDTYKKEFTKVPLLWKTMEAAAISAVLNKYRYFNVNKITFYSTREFLYMILPAGRAIAYHKPNVVKNDWGQPALTYYGYNSQIKKYEQQKTWGGKLVENACQAVGRDFMVEAMLIAEERDYTLKFTIHDQLLAETKKDFGSVKEFNNIMEIIPIWGKGCPIKAETQECYRFKK